MGHTPEQIADELMALAGTIAAATTDEAAALVREAAALLRTNALTPELTRALYQYRDDLRYPPAPDSIIRRIAMIDAIIAKAEAA